MHKHDLDLIADYAGGNLAEEAKARSLIESCPTCASEFELQRTVAGELRVGRATMSDHEKAALHRDLWTELRSGVAAEAPRRSWWQTSWAFGAAAMLFVAVGLTGILSNMEGDDGAGVQTFSEIGSGLSGSGGDDTGAESEQAPTVEDTDGLEAPEERYADTPFTQIAQQVRQAPRSVAQVQFDNSQEAQDCLDEAGLSGYLMLAGYEQLTELLLAIPAEAERVATAVAFIDPDTCEVVHVEE